MKEQLQEIVDMEDVRGLAFISFKGRLIHQQFKTPLAEDLAGFDFAALAGSLARVKEAELLFQKARIYVRATEIGYLLIVMEVYASVPMVRMSSDLAASRIKDLKEAAKEAKPSLSFGRLFRKKDKM